MAVKKQIKRSFTREEKGLLVLCVLVLIDIVTHFTHPAYKYYRTFCTNLEKRNTAFQDQIKRDFVPAITLFASNVIASSSSPVSASPVVVSASSAVPSTPQLSSSSINARFFFYRGFPYIDLNGFYYTLGDNFDGSEIQVLTPVVLKTSIGSYSISPLSTTKQRIE